MPLFTSMIRWAGVLIPNRLKCHLRMALGVLNIEASLLNMKRNGFDPGVIIDVGAYCGNWTRMCKRIFPDAHVLMIEPQMARRADLDRVLAEYSGVELAPVLVGPTEQVAVDFYECGPVSSVLPESEKKDSPTTSLQMTTLDALVKNSIFACPDLIKLDVQGYEIEVLKGGIETLASGTGVLMEVNLIDINKGAPLFHDAVAFMADRGFRVYDICSFGCRPYDRALWQVDVIFVNSSSPLVSSKRWS